MKTVSSVHGQNRKGIETEAVRADLRNIYFKHIGLARVMVMTDLIPISR